MSTPVPAGPEVAYRAATRPDHPRANWRGFQPGVEILPVGSTYQQDGRELTCDIRMDRDVAVPLRDGTVIYVDVLRADRDVDSAVPALVVWSPYGKQGGFWNYDVFPARAGVALSATSGLEKFEGPDPAFWCEAGYAVVHVDPRGSFQSEGDVHFWNTAEAQDGHDVVEWVGEQSWCTGAVGMAGNSWLSVTQWRIAETHPSHLKAIAPWEGLTDVYRDVAFTGGVPNRNFITSLVVNNFGQQRAEDAVAMMDDYPTMNAYWEDKIAMTIPSITIPAYVVASWSSPIHTRGTLAGWEALPEGNKWLRVHNTQEWPDQYSHEDDLRRFFDWALRGIDNGWTATPTVRLSVFNAGAEDIVDRAESSYPLARARRRTFHLDAADGSLADEPPRDSGSRTYDSTTGEEVVFETSLDQEMEIVGPMRLRLYFSIAEGNDADIFAIVRKAAPDGRLLMTEMMPGVPVPGAVGKLRLSHRALDEAVSNDLVPRLTHESEEVVEPGEVVAVDIEIWPAGMRWSRGEKLQVVVTGVDPWALLLDGEDGAPTPNLGVHRVHTGADYPSTLTVPETT